MVGRLVRLGWAVGPVWFAGLPRMVGRLAPVPRYVGWAVDPGILAGWPRLVGRLTQQMITMIMTIMANDDYV